MNIVIEGGTVVTNDPQRRVIKDGFVAIENDQITAVGRSHETKPSCGKSKVIDARGKTVIPGLVNTHTHMFQCLGRGLGDDLDLWTWLQRFMFPFSAAMSAEDVLVGASMACIEMIKSGTTCAVDNHFQSTDTITILKVTKAMETAGIRGMVARGITGEYNETADRLKLPRSLFRYSADEEIQITEQCMNQVNEKTNRLVSVWPGPLNIVYVDPELLLKSHELAEKHGVGMHIHCSEAKTDPVLVEEKYGERPVELLHSLGLLSPRLHVVHGIWLSDKEVDLMGKTHTFLVHNPVSNMYLASGIARVRELLDKGAQIALGTDGPASNNNQDMFAVMKATALLQKVNNLDPTALSAEQVFEMATLGGACALGLERKIGSIEVGKKADIAILDLKKPHISPIHREISAIVYCASGGDVETTIVNGEIVMENGVILTLDEGKTIEEAQEVANRLVQKAGLTELRDRSWIRKTSDEKSSYE